MAFGLEITVLDHSVLKVVFFYALLQGAPWMAPGYPDSGPGMLVTLGLGKLYPMLTSPSEQLW